MLMWEWLTHCNLLWRRKVHSLNLLVEDGKTELVSDFSVQKMSKLTVMSNELSVILA